MYSPLITRAKATRLAAVLVALAMCLGVGGFTAMSASAAASAPDAPTNVFATDDGGSGVNVSWDPALTGDAADYFTVLLDDHVVADRRSSANLAGDSDSALVLSVPPGTYDVTVVAWNSAGPSPAAAADDGVFVATLNLSVPSEPLNVVAHNAGDGALRITWDAPISDGGTPIEEYQISVQYPNSVDPSYGGPFGVFNGQIVDGSGREFTFRHLEFNHGDFIVTVNAVNASRFPGYETITDPPAPLVRSTVPSAPTQVSAVSSAANKVTVTWAAPSSDGGFAVDGYLVIMGQNFGTFTSATDRTATFTDVPAGSHTVSMFASNVNGDSVEATASVTVHNPVVPPVVTPPVVTPPVKAPVAQAPSPPRNVAVATHKGGKAVVTFRAPRYLHHRAITSYIVKLAGQRKHVDGATLTVTFRGLTKGTHIARVYARNKAGRSHASREHVLMPRAKAAHSRITLKLGMLGWSVRQVQVKLMPAKAHMGEFDAATRTAVLRWQRNHHKALTGVVNARMRSALGI